MVENTYCTCNDWYFGRTAKAPMMTANAKADDNGLGSLKGHVHTAAMVTQANNYTWTTKAIAKHVGPVHGNEMRQLVLNGKESTPTEPTYPDGTNVTGKDKAIWGKRHDLFLKQEVQCKDQKAKCLPLSTANATRS